MFPWRKRRGGPFDDFFDLGFDFGEEFQRIQEEMQKMMEEARSLSKNPPSQGKPIVYGWSMRVGPDGKPHIEKFGNVPAKTPEGSHHASDEREPLTDVVEGKEEVKVMAELPGVEKKDVKLEAGEHSLYIHVDSRNRKYSKELELPCKVKPDTTKANYNNGVLEVTIKRAEKKKEHKTTKVKVE